LAGILSACTSTQPNIPAPPVVEVIGPKPGDLAFGFRALVERELAKYPKLKEIPGDRIAYFCPKKPKTDVEFWTRFMEALCRPESNCRATMTYIEGTMDKDPITGRQVRSEGLFQMSYQDKNSYGPACDFDWPHDREMALSDFDAKLKYGNPARHIYSVDRQFACAFKVFSDHLFRYSPKADFDQAIGSYWYVMKRKHREEFESVQSGMKGICQ